VVFGQGNYRCWKNDQNEGPSGCLLTRRLHMREEFDDGSQPQRVRRWPVLALVIGSFQLNLMNPCSEQIACSVIRARLVISHDNASKKSRSPALLRCRPWEGRCAKKGSIVSGASLSGQENQMFHKWAALPSRSGRASILSSACQLANST